MEFYKIMGPFQTRAKSFERLIAISEISEIKLKGSFTVSSKSFESLIKFYKTTGNKII